MHPEVTDSEQSSCPKCGMKLVPDEAAPTSYVCPMHPEVTASEPAACPKCGMKLVRAVADAEVPHGGRAGTRRRTRATRRMPATITPTGSSGKT